MLLELLKDAFPTSPSILGLFYDDTKDKEVGGLIKRKKWSTKIINKFERWIEILGRQQGREDDIQTLGNVTIF